MYYTDRQKQDIFNSWCEYQTEHKMPIPEGGHNGYTDSVYKLWENILMKGVTN